MECFDRAIQAPLRKKTQRNGFLIETIITGQNKTIISFRKKLTEIVNVNKYYYIVNLPFQLCQNIYWGQGKIIIF